MRTEHRAPRIPLVLAWTTLFLFGCTPRTAAPRVADGGLREETPKSMPGVEVALPPIARRVVRRIGPLLPNTAALFAARLLCELAGTCPEALTPEVAEHVRKRVGW